MKRSFLPLSLVLSAALVAQVEPSPSRQDNLVAFAKVYGWVRWFHPSDEAKAADWNRLAVLGVRHVELCRSPVELAERLLEVFAPVAPTLEISTTPLLAKTATDSATSALAWHHSGYGFGNPGIYRSTRRRLSKSGPDLNTPWEATLPGGLHLRMQLALPCVDGKTIPAASAQLLGQGDGGKLRESPELAKAVLIVAWNWFQHFYPYFDVVEVDWPLALRDALSAVEKPDFKTGDILRELTAKARDGHVWVRDPHARASFMLPLELGIIEGQITVLATLPDSDPPLPQRGDVVTAIDGELAAAVLQRLSSSISASTTGWLQHRVAQQLCTRATDRPVRLKLRDLAGKERETELTPFAPGVVGPPTENRPEHGSELAPGVVYCNLVQAKTSDLKKVMAKLKTADGIVFDLRGYPDSAGMEVLRHLATEAVQSAFWNIPQIDRPDRTGMTFKTSGRWNLLPTEPHLPKEGGRVAFVIDGSAISYAESCLGIVEAYQLAALVGEPTAGSNGNVQSIELPGDYRVSFTGMQVLKHDGSRHHCVGILPTVPCSRTIAGVAAGRDELLAKAIEVVRPK